MPKKVANALTPLTVKNAKPGRHADGGGLHLLVKDSGARSWVYRFMLRGKSRDVGLGSAVGADAVSLAVARDLAAALRLKVKSGVDPLAERLEAATAAVAASQASKIAGITFEAVAEAYIAAHSDGWRNAKHRQQWTSTLATYVYPVMGALPVANVGTAHVLSVLEPIWKAKPETASRVRGRIETILDAAKARGYREGENPARWRGHIAQILPARTRLSRGHHKALPYVQLPAFIAKLREREATCLRSSTILSTVPTQTATSRRMSARNTPHNGSGPMAASPKKPPGNIPILYVRMNKAAADKAVVTTVRSDNLSVLICLSLRRQVTSNRLMSAMGRKRTSPTRHTTLP